MNKAIKVIITEFEIIMSCISNEPDVTGMSETPKAVFDLGRRSTCITNLRVSTHTALIMLSHVHRK